MTMSVNLSPCLTPPLHTITNTYHDYHLWHVDFGFQWQEKSLSTAMPDSLFALYWNWFEDILKSGWQLNIC